MPPPKRIDGATVWDLPQLDLAFDALPDEAEKSSPGEHPWD